MGVEQRFLISPPTFILLLFTIISTTRSQNDATLPLIWAGRHSLSGREGDGTPAAAHKSQVDKPTQTDRSAMQMLQHIISGEVDEDTLAFLRDGEHYHY
jgi:hypothetical protein